MKRLFIAWLGLLVLVFGACGGANTETGGPTDEVQAPTTATQTPAPMPTPIPAPTPASMSTPAPHQPDAEQDYEQGLWHPGNFANARGPLHLAYYTPHGYLAMRHIVFMNDNLYARSPFTYREKEAAAWLVEELLAMGHTWDNIRVQEFYRGGDFIRAKLGPRMDEPMRQWVLGDAQPRYYSQNVILTVPGQSGQVIIVGAHYDTLPFPGASDNASGTALLLESAQRMLHQDNYHTIKYVFFGAEEVGLIGAHYFRNALPSDVLDNLILMINADVLLEGPYLIYGAGYSHAGQRTARENAVSRQVDDIARQMYYIHGIEIISSPQTIFLSSDQLVFVAEGDTVVMLFGAELTSDGNFSFRVLHTERDDIHYINQAWPGKADANMQAFSIFLEKLLLARY